MKRVILILLFGSAGLVGQTMIDLRTQARSVDFSTASTTRPWKIGFTLPANCEPGQSFFKTDAEPGSNLHVCTRPNEWTVVASSGGGGGAAMSGQLRDLEVERSSATVLTVGSACSTATPCNVRQGGTVFSITAPATAKLLGIDNGRAYIYIDRSGALTIGCDGLRVFSVGMSVREGVSAFPADSIPLWSWSASAGAWDSAGGADRRALLTGKSVLAGAGIGVLDNPINGTSTVMVDSAVIPRYFTGTGAPTLRCTQGRDFYLDTTSGDLHKCVATDTWASVTAAGAGTGDMVAADYVKSGAGAPSGACAPNGAAYRDTAPAPNTFYLCAQSAWVGPIATAANIAALGGIYEPVDPAIVRALADGSVARVVRLPESGVVTVADTSLTLGGAHNGKIIRFTAGTDITVTAPAGLGAGFSCLLVQRGTGAITPAAGGGVTIRQRQSLTKTAGQYAIATLACDTADDCILAGDLQ